MASNRTSEISQNFPFCAIVGQEALRSALLLNMVDPGLGGVLVRGDKGTGKTTAVRSLRGIMPAIQAIDCPYSCDPQDLYHRCPQCRKALESLFSQPVITKDMPFVELPLNATEDRIAGILQIEQALKSGERYFEPGLLAAANRGLLYVDEVNLLPDHLVDILLDAAASGVNTVEREGVSFSHPAKFMLIGTMNPEEGELRPQFLDRFGLSVEIKTLQQATDRREIIQRRLVFEADPRKYTQEWRQRDEIVKQRILGAREILEKVNIPHHQIDLAVRLAAAGRVSGHRAEILIIKTARALAAFTGDFEISNAHITEAALYVLPHRLQNWTLDSEGDQQNRLRTLITQVFNEKKPAEGELSENFETSDTETEGMQIPGAAAAGSIVFEFLKKKALM
ncbi:ATP-binding protein [candidate division KSB1 bacterium]|nr:ATP-binding protein [candidate division KSB1 bacterium]